MNGDGDVPDDIGFVFGNSGEIGRIIHLMPDTDKNPNRYF